MSISPYNRFYCTYLQVPIVLYGLYLYCIMYNVLFMMDEIVLANGTVIRFAYRKDLSNHLPPEELLSSASAEPISTFLQSLLRQREMSPAPPLCVPKPLLPAAPFLIPVTSQPPPPIPLPVPSPQNSNLQFGFFYVPQYVPFPFMIPAGAQLPAPAHAPVAPHFPPHFQLPVSVCFSSSGVILYTFNYQLPPTFML